MDEQVFLSALDEAYDPATLAAWADWLEGQGRPYRAVAVRYLFQRGVHPEQTGYPPRFHWSHNKGWEEVYLAPAIHCRLNWVAYKHLCKYHSGGPNHFPTRSEAFLPVVEVLEQLAELQDGLKI